MTMTRFLFPILACARRLRGTCLDPFRLQADRKVEQGLIGWYQGLMARFDPAEDLVAWRGILGAASDIRGYGPVKMAAAARVKDDVETRLGILERT